MAVFNECPECGAHLDPGERCDCKEEIAPVQSRAWEQRGDSWQNKRLKSQSVTGRTASRMSGAFAGY